MSSHQAEENNDGFIYDEPLDPIDEITVAAEEEEDAASYLVPRLAAYAEASSSASSSSRTPIPLHKDNVDNNAGSEEEGMTEEDGIKGEIARGRESGGRSAGRVPGGSTDEALLWVNEEDDEEGNNAEARDNGFHVGQSDSEDKSSSVQSSEEGGDVGGEHAEDEDEVVEEDDGGKNDIHRSHRHHGTTTNSSSYANAFAHNRVKELLKYEGSSSIISKDAAAATCEAVALLMLDLVAMAAGEATRKHRKTLTYDDVARVAQLLDRFSFLADVVPPAQASSSGAALDAGKSIIVGSHVHPSNTGVGGGARKKNAGALGRSKSVQGRERASGATTAAGTAGSDTARSKTAHGRVAHSSTTQGVHPHPGGMRQSTLRF